MGIYNKRVAFIGISMGAFAVFGSLKGQVQPDACVSILGSPDWSQPNKPEDEPKSILELSGPANDSSSLSQTPIMIVNAGKDMTVSANPSRLFVDKIKGAFHKKPDNLVYLEYPESDHSMRECDWNDAWTKVLSWLKVQGF